MKEKPEKTLSYVELVHVFYFLLLLLKNGAEVLKPQYQIASKLFMVLINGFQKKEWQMKYGTESKSVEKAKKGGDIPVQFCVLWALI